ncbi:MAG: hypothetical protein AB1427_02795 [Thermodesulfobacteriota bacterium]
MKSKFTLSFLVVTATGFAATVAQIILLREFLVRFYGNELSVGIVLAAWLMWNAVGSGLSVRRASQKRPDQGTLALFLSLLAAMLPVCVLLIRLSGAIWSIPMGELAPLGKMLMITIAVTGLICPLSGALFGLCWAYHCIETGESRPARPIMIYLGEAVGAALGGLIFYFVFMGGFSALTAAWLTSAGLLAVSGAILVSRRHVAKLPAGRWWLVVAVAVCAGFLLNGPIDAFSRRLQWTKDGVVVFDTPYHNIALVRKNQQLSVFSNGLWLFSASDPQSAENAVHLALLQHPRPETILLLGGAAAGLLEEILKHSPVRRVDCVEPDPDFVVLVEPFLPAATRESLRNPKVRLIHQDAGTFIRSPLAHYDIILMNMGDPVNSQMNRFYTKEFFGWIQKSLGPGGIFSFSISAGEDMMGPGQAYFLKSFEATLLQIFPDVRLHPGDHTRFFATDAAGRLLSQTADFMERIAERNLQLLYIRPDTLDTALSPFRRSYYRAILGEIRETPVNHDFKPTCYFYNMLIWGGQWHPALQQFLKRVAEIKAGELWATIGVIGLIVSVFFLAVGRFRTAVAGSVMVMGGAGMVMQMVLLLGFQVAAGFFYLQLSLIIAFFMAGLAAGSGWFARFRAMNPRNVLIIIQGAAVLFPAGVIFFFSALQGEFRAWISLQSTGWMFSALSLFAGTIAGAHFSTAVRVLEGQGIDMRHIGGGLYAMDLAGAAGGMLLAAFITIPVFGLMDTLLILSALLLISLISLFGPGRQ